MNVKVVPVSCNTKRLVRLPDRYDFEFPDHYQDYHEEEQLYELLEYILRTELSVDPGVTMDTLVVNGNTGNEKWNSYLATLNGIKTTRGRLIVYTRENVGWSFGAFADAFEKFCDDYTFWLFTEDDIVFTGHEYMKRMIIKMDEEDAGFVANAVCDSGYGTHAGGGVGLTSRDVLREVRRTFRRLSHDASTEIGEDVLGWRNRVIYKGEVPFTNDIHLLGKRIVQFGQSKWWYPDKLCAPFYHIKHELHKI